MDLIEVFECEAHHAEADTNESETHAEGDTSCSHHQWEFLKGSSYDFAVQAKQLKT